MVVVHGQTVPLKVPIGHLGAGTVMPAFLDVWTVISVVPLSPDRTELSIAWVSPETGHIAPLSANGTSPEGGDNRASPYVATHEAVSARLRTASQALAAKKPTSKNLAERRGLGLVAQIVMNQFLHDLAVQLLGPGRWHEKFGGE